MDRFILQGCTEVRKAGPHEAIKIVVVGRMHFEKYKIFDLYIITVVNMCIFIVNKCIYFNKKKK